VRIIIFRANGIAHFIIITKYNFIIFYDNNKKNERKSVIYLMQTFAMLAQNCGTCLLFIKGGDSIKVPALYRTLLVSTSLAFSKNNLNNFFYRYESDK